MAENTAERKREVVFKAETDELLEAGLRSIPGFTFQRNGKDFQLEGHGQTILFVSSVGHGFATTANVLPQDLSSEAIPLSDDVLVKLAHAARDVPNLSTYPTLTDAEVSEAVVSE
ncbi:hypothetical protein [Achromobacter xylosoxidans]|uniref:hypothetical protein n=1 Tax=Alcaligenes xylosoxydans xylosoxydans TaxID=85698 RepID=UPI001910866D|nr:hypothetical protein [Achromobacter xylosoxidans]QQE57595.1 hypothetical protein I6H41_00655 [Achromobacter xylosoxidans]QQV17234.1 hypothetical protein I6I48_15790 [Achromobacter xylosoxidans]UXL07184.1 hypothetical protein N4T34_10920 [Achromobacter xylosoxidans]